jgi:chitinase
MNRSIASFRGGISSLCALALLLVLSPQGYAATCVASERGIHAASNGVDGIALRVSNRTMTEATSGNLLSGIPVQLTGTAKAICTTDMSGEYQTALLTATGNFTVSPQVAEGTPVPASRSFSTLSSDTLDDFTVETPIRMHGYVKDGTEPLSGISVVFSAQVSGWYWQTSTTDATGYYSFNDVPEGAPEAYLQIDTWQGTFYPSNRVDIGTVTGTVQQDFNKQPVSSAPTLSGRVLLNGNGLNTVTMTLTNLTSGASGQTLTDSSGAYLFEDLTASNSYRVTPSRLNYHFSPTNRQVDQLTVDTQLDDFSATFTGALYSLSGTVRGTNALPVANVSVSLSGDVTSNTFSSAQGAYQFSGLPAGGSYTVRFTGEGYVFSPASGSFSNLSQHAVLDTVAAPSAFTPIPDKVVVGYWHNWQSMASPFMPLREVTNTRFNICNVSFIETLNQDGVHPVFSVDNGGIGYTADTFKQDVAILQNAGIPVLVSIGGQNGHVELSNETEKDTYVQGIIAIVEEYGFDGIDIDYEGGSMTIFNGPANSIEYADITDPELKYGIDAIRDIQAHFGDGFIITAAPELAYVQEGRRAYPAGSQFVPFLHNIRDILSYLHVQYYNFGSSVWGALDDQVYDKGEADLVVAMTDMLIAGFPVGSTAFFPGLRPDQVAFGLPCSPSAGNGYMTTNEVIKALDYLIRGNRAQGMNYTLRGPGAPWPDLRGIMTWSINWDATTDGGTAPYEFSDTYSTWFQQDGPPPVTIPDWWKIHYFGTTNIQENADADGDTQSNAEEYIAATDPTNRTSFFCIQHSSDQENNQRIYWQAATGRSYTVYSGTNLYEGLTQLETNLLYPSHYWTFQLEQYPDDAFISVKVKMQDFQDIFFP